MGVNILGAPDHAFLFKATHPFADGGFDFSLCSHGGLTSWGRGRRATGDSGLKTRLFVRQTR